ncbi:MAG: class I SAM-dependent methyltransferase [Gemmatimonadota bacterium]|nr:class I SAM-dependent methyltransferase [Gemmatimonadota bacterium]
MNQNTQSGQFAARAADYDRLQPVRIEMYEFYHGLAVDFVPFDTGTEFRILDLGCGTGAFIELILDRYANATCVAVDYSGEMIEIAARKVSAHSDRVEFLRRDLNGGVPEGLGSFQLVSSFSTIHHLTDENKTRVFGQIHDVLIQGGWFFLIDAMSVHFDDDVFRQGRRRYRIRRKERFHRAGICPEEANRVAEIVGGTEADSPEKDRISPLAAQIEWLKEAGFGSVDHIWHFWMEHFIICRK